MNEYIWCYVSVLKMMHDQSFFHSLGLSWGCMGESDTLRCRNCLGKFGAVGAGGRCQLCHTLFNLWELVLSDRFPQSGGSEIEQGLRSLFLRSLELSHNYQKDQEESEGSEESEEESHTEKDAHIEEEATKEAGEEKKEEAPLAGIGAKSKPTPKKEKSRSPLGGTKDKEQSEHSRKSKKDKKEKKEREKSHRHRRQRSPRSPEGKKAKRKSRSRSPGQPRKLVKEDPPCESKDPKELSPRGREKKSRDRDRDRPRGSGETSPPPGRWEKPEASGSRAPRSPSRSPQRAALERRPRGGHHYWRAQHPDSSERGSERGPRPSSGPVSKEDYKYTNKGAKKRRQQKRRREGGLGGRQWGGR